MSKDTAPALTIAHLRMVKSCTDAADVETVTRKMHDACISDAMRVEITKAIIFFGAHAVTVLEDLERESQREGGRGDNA